MSVATIPIYIIALQASNPSLWVILPIGGLFSLPALLDGCGGQIFLCRTFNLYRVRTVAVKHRPELGEDPFDVF